MDTHVDPDFGILEETLIVLYNQLAPLAVLYNRVLDDVDMDVMFR